MQRVLIITTTPLMYDGLTKMILEICRHSDPQKIHFDITVFTKVPPAIAETFRQTKSHIYTLPDRNHHTLKYVKQLSKLIRKKNYQVVHVHGNSATMFFDIFAAWLGGASIRISHSHNSATQHPAMHKLLKPFLNRLTTTPIACSQEAGKWVFSKPFHIIQNGIEYPRYQYNPETRKEYRKSLGWEKQFIIGHVGRFSYQKNHAFLLQIFAAIHQKDANARLLLIGEGETLETSKNLARQLQIEPFIDFHGTVDNVWDYMQAMDVLLLPSHFEGLGIVGIEAQACGLPCVVSDKVPKALQITELVHFVSLDKSPEEWADIILQLKNISRTDQTTAIKESGYDIQSTVQNLEKLYAKK
jgi:glycosyltransferase involved in cell wall biosynthesis